MAYAPHTNTDIDRGANLPLILGCVYHATTGKAFEYAIRPNTGNDFAPDCPHIIYVGGLGDYRFAKVLKTVAFVVVDEDDNGPVYEKWDLKRNHRIYDTTWMKRKGG